MYHIETITSLSMGENAYVFSAREGKECIVVDPGEKTIGEHPALQNKELQGILLTHGHFDHIEGISSLLSIWDVPIYIHHADQIMLSDARANLSAMFGTPYTVSGRVIPLSTEEITVGNFTFQVIPTPGHTKGSVCYQIEDHLFTGDTLFDKSWGRTDFPGGNEEEMEESITRLMLFPQEWAVYSGHGQQTTILRCKEFFHANRLFNQ